MDDSNFKRAEGAGARAFGARFVALAYAMAGVTALGVAATLSAEHPVVLSAWADAAATVAVFAFSLAFRNSSFYDAYWSVAPVPIALYWALGAGAEQAAPLRQVLVLALVLAWSARLTYNWWRGWGGLDHEDWRYVAIRESSGSAYWPVSFLGIHMVPTAIVFLGCLPLWPALATGAGSFSALDGVAALVTGGAIWIEARADRELFSFRRSGPAPDAILSSGVWSWSRHPNYLGEMGFWWGLWLFAMAASPTYWWTAIGPLTITLMFRTISLPMIEKRMLERRPHYAELIERSSMVIPRMPRR
jgi:steroid 5-alpha reductase family enzyme